MLVSAIIAWEGRPVAGDPRTIWTKKAIEKLGERPDVTFSRDEHGMLIARMMVELVHYDLHEI